jgi:lysophospholipase L1-like esterase
MVVLGDSYGKGIGASMAADAYPVQLGRMLGITDVHHFTCVSSTGIMKGTTTNAYRTRLQPIIDAKPDIVLFQGSINDADQWPLYQGQIGPQFKLDIATLKAGLPNAIIIVTSPLEVRVATAMN